MDTDYSFKCHYSLSCASVMSESLDQASKMQSMPTKGPGRNGLLTIFVFLLLLVILDVLEISDHMCVQR